MNKPKTGLEWMNTVSFFLLCAGVVIFIVVAITIGSWWDIALSGWFAGLAWNQRRKMKSDAREKKEFAKAFQAIENKETAETYESITFTLIDILPELVEIVDCPVCKGWDRVSAIVIHLNDLERWSREDIADWLDTLDIDLTFQERGDR